MYPFNLGCLAISLAALSASAHLKAGSLKPAGGESFQIGKTVTIEWSTDQAHDGRYDIYFSSDAGKTYPLELAGPWQGSKTDGAKNTYLWSPKAEHATTKGRIRICQLSGGHCVQPGVYMMDSPADFTIAEAATAIQGEKTSTQVGAAMELLADNGTLNIRLNLTEAQTLSVKAYDVAGNWVATFAQGDFKKGEHQITAIEGTTTFKGPLVFKLDLGANGVTSQLWNGF